MTIEESYMLGQKDERKIIKAKIPFLRQFLNDQSQFSHLVMDEEIGYFLGLNTAEEVEEARRRYGGSCMISDETLNKVKKHL